MTSKIEKCNAFSLRITNYSNTSQITQFFTDKFGTIGVISKGSRNPKSTLYGLIQLLSNYEILIYKKENTLSLLKEISIINDNEHIFNEIDKSSVAQAAAELYLQLIFEKNDYIRFYNLLENYLYYLKKINKNYILIFWRFLRRVASYLGFALDFNKCQVCKQSNHENMRGVSFEYNGFICKNCLKKIGEKKYFECSKQTLDILSSLKNISPKINEINLTSKTIKEINTVFKTYLNYHLHKEIHLRSLEIL